MKDIRHYQDNIKRKILIVDDDLNIQESFGELLKNDYEPYHATNGEQALEILRRKDISISLVLLDLKMPVMDGYSLLSIMREDEKLKRMPVIALLDDRSTKSKSLRVGAQDFIIKPYDRSEIILQRVKNMITLAEEGNFILRTENDALTGLATKIYFYEYIKVFDKYNPDIDMDCVVINIKKFHTLNEMLGRRTCDKLLVNIAKALSGLMEDYEGIASRVESDTFYLYISSQDDYQEIILEALDDAIRKFNKIGRIAFKIGVNRKVDKLLTIEKRFDDALGAMRLNKDSLVTTIMVYDQQMHEKELYNEKLVLEFEKSLANKEFVVYFQPKMDITGEEPTMSSAEALVRWIHPEYGVIGPNVFIPLFESNGLIQRLDKYIWNEACAQIKKWKDEFNKTIRVSINVSRVDLFSAHLIDDLLEIIKDNNISIDDIYLEVTESACMEDAKEVTRRVKALKEQGFIIEMDDFGTGYSSLHMVSSLPIDALKIDMSFIRNILSSEKAKRMVQIILEIAKLLNAKTIAEGVESKEQLIALKEMGIDLVQGFYFSKAIPVEEFNELYLK